MPQVWPYKDQKKKKKKERKRIFIAKNTCRYEYAEQLDLNSVAGGIQGIAAQFL